MMDAEVIAVHVLGVSPDYVDLRQSSRQALDNAVVPLRERGVDVKPSCWMDHRHRRSTKLRCGRTQT